MGTTEPYVSAKTEENKARKQFNYRKKKALVTLFLGLVAVTIIVIVFVILYVRTGDELVDYYPKFKF